ncbi:hypothetical protein DVK44_12670 [Streptomyces paludis]|uniref:Uncharacterized protein n=1 Tax=Streptomyces paludis TaxID=2282738 RepID=A0A345HNZ9_9ACTN|nr:hypothetical protein DVK44_12670 [Streptomyces paludis]
MCSPRVRGWSLRPAAGRQHQGVLPARAGVVPARPRSWPAFSGAPRACGGGPPVSPTRIA